MRQVRILISYLQQHFHMVLILFFLPLSCPFIYLSMFIFAPSVFYDLYFSLHISLKNYVTMDIHLTGAISRWCSILCDYLNHTIQNDFTKEGAWSGIVCCSVEHEIRHTLQSVGIVWDTITCNEQNQT